MPAPRSPGLAATVLILVLIAGAAAVTANVWPVWASCSALLVFFGGAWWVMSRQERAALRADVPDPPEVAERTARADARRTAEAAAAREETERVEAALAALLARAGARYRYQSPMGGHMDKREATYDVAAPLAVSAQDVAALSGPASRLTLVTAAGGQVYLTRLDARAPDGVGVEATAPTP